MDTMNQSEVYAPNPLSTYAADITEQVAFIDWWWENAFRKVVA